MAVTYDVTPANGGANAVGTLETTAQINGYLIAVKSTSNGDNTAVDLSANDGATGSLYDLILRELSPLMAHAVNDTSGVMSIIVDNHANTADSIAARLEALDGVGTDTTVTAASSFAVA
jgi:hypothetical protein